MTTITILTSDNKQPLSLLITAAKQLINNSGTITSVLIHIDGPTVDLPQELKCADKATMSITKHLRVVRIDGDFEVTCNDVASFNVNPSGTYGGEFVSMNC